MATVTTTVSAPSVRDDQAHWFRSVSGATTSSIRFTAAHETATPTTTARSDRTRLRADSRETARDPLPEVPAVPGLEPSSRPLSTDVVTPIVGSLIHRSTRVVTRALVGSVVAPVQGLVDSDVNPLVGSLLQPLLPTWPVSLATGCVPPSSDGSRVPFPRRSLREERPSTTTGTDRRTRPRSSTTCETASPSSIRPDCSTWPAGPARSRFPSPPTSPRSAAVRPRDGVRRVRPAQSRPPRCTPTSVGSLQQPRPSSSTARLTSPRIGNAVPTDFDRDAVAGRLAHHLAERGCVALLWSRNPWNGDQPWQLAMHDILEHWMDTAGLRDRGPVQWEQTIAEDPHERVLRRWRGSRTRGRSSIRPCNDGTSRRSSGSSTRHRS